jgi:hypothetical protein
MSEKKMITIIDALTNEVSERELTLEEITEAQELAEAAKLDKSGSVSETE